jgi:hypothetical protein
MIYFSDFNKVCRSPLWIVDKGNGEEEAQNVKKIKKK